MTGERGFDFSPSHLLVNDLLMLIPRIYILKWLHLLQTFGTKNKKLTRNVREGKNTEVSLLCTCACGCGDNLTVKQRDYNILVKNMKEFYYTKETIYPQELNWPMLISHFQPLHLESWKTNLEYLQSEASERNAFKQLACLHRNHFLHGLSRIEVPSAPFGTQGLAGSAPKAYTLKGKKNGCNSIKICCQREEHREKRVKWKGLTRKVVVPDSPLSMKWGAGNEAKCSQQVQHNQLQYLAIQVMCSLIVEES